MSQQIIRIGDAPNDGSGESLRSAGQKINANFDDLYATRATIASLNQAIAALSIKTARLTIAVLGQTVFTLSSAIARPDLTSIFLNGVRAAYGIHYSIDGVILTWLSPVVLEPDYILELIWY